ncbi:Ribonuclease D [gamma proteobacterium IMCC2047]|nr:Ribonuclease D [gamma proteobacterium IMCC2047]
MDYLIELYEQQVAALQDKGRLSWAQEEMQVMLNKQRRNTDPAEAYLKVKGANKLTEDQVQIIQRLAEWREIQARQRNIPRGFILKDPQLLDIAQRLPDTTQSLGRTEGLRRRVVKEDGEQILRLVNQETADEERVPAFPEPLPPRAKPLVKELQALLAGVAESVDLMPELLLSRKSLVAMLTHLMHGGEARLPADLPSWKRTLFGEPLLTALADMKGKI